MVGLAGSGASKDVQIMLGNGQFNSLLVNNDEIDGHQRRRG